jgi:predicted HAD superfamily Cof-like phosphohydrolase
MQFYANERSATLAFPIQQQVIDFHKKFGHPVRDTPQTIDEGEAIQAYGFIEEELLELWHDALFPNGTDCGEEGCCQFQGEYQPNLIEIADALGDIVFTAYGMAARHGIDLDRVLAEICASNMSKEANGMGKIKKGADYFPPNIARALTI